LAIETIDIFQQPQNSTLPPLARENGLVYEFRAREGRRRRRAQDNRRIPRRYYYPERTQCPRCRHGLTRAYPVWRKYLVCLSGRSLVISVGYWCRNPTGPSAKQKRRFASPEAAAVTVRGSSCAREVIVQMGDWRFWQRWPGTQLHEGLTQERYLPSSERAGWYLLGILLVLLRCP
jgi:hypothetical protein